jgi:hypothetical protein
MSEPTAPRVPAVLPASPRADLETAGIRPDSQPVGSPPDQAEPAAREAFVLPLLFLTVTLAGGLRVTAGGELRFLPPPLFTLVLAMLLMGVLVRGGVLAPERLMGVARSPLANLGGAVVLFALFFASAQLFNSVTPERGLLHLVFDVFFLVLLWNTAAAGPRAADLLHSLAVVFGSAFVLKYIVFASLYDPAGGLAKRVLTTLLEGVTLGTLAYEPDAAPTGYVAFATIVFYMIGLVLLPRGDPTRP